MYLTISQTYKNKDEEKFKTKLDKIDFNMGDIIYPTVLNLTNDKNKEDKISNITIIKIKDITDKSIKFIKENDGFVLTSIIDKKGNTNTDLQHLTEFELLFGDTLFIDASTKNEYRTICIDKV